MTNIRRYYRTGDWVFLTNVTYRRRPILTESGGILADTLLLTCRKTGIEISAWVILPDHVHLILGIDATKIPALMRRVKLSYSAWYRRRHGMSKGRLWQYRYWDHIIRDQHDMNRHVDYLHYNPVKHGYAESPFHWKWSSIHDYVKAGVYAPDWGRVKIANSHEFGE